MAGPFPHDLGYAIGWWLGLFVLIGGGLLNRWRARRTAKVLRESIDALSSSPEADS